MLLCNDLVQLHYRMSQYYKKIALAKQMLDTAKKSIKSAETILDDLVSISGVDEDPQADYIRSQIGELQTYTESEGDNVVEGIFDGERMISEDGQSYPVPANYASKSKLVVGDALKLTITETGNYLYKQIGPVERRRLVGVLVKEDGKYFAMTDGKLYQLLLAAVTYTRAQIGDKLAVLVPEDSEDVAWAALDHILPEVDGVKDTNSEEVF